MKNPQTGWAITSSKGYVYTRIMAHLKDVLTSLHSIALNTQ